MFKSIIFLITSLLVVSFSFAGVHGGGVMMTVSSTSSPELAPARNAFDNLSSPKIVYNIGEKNGAVKFAYGQLVDSQWKIQNFTVAQEELKNRSELLTALQDSKELKDWVTVK